MHIIDTISMAGTLTEHGRQSEGAFFTDSFGLIMNTGNIAQEDWSKYNEPYRSSDWQVLMILQGKGYISYNLVDQELEQGDIIIQKPGTLLTQHGATNDFEGRCISISVDLIPSYTMNNDFQHIHPTAEQFGNIESYMQLLSQLTMTYDDEIAAGLVYSLFNYINKIYSDGKKRIEEDKRHHVSRQTLTYRKFLALLNQHGTREHKIAFYADQMSMTPNYLNSIIKQVSGKTMMDWINEYLITEAKAALAHSGMSVENISDALHFTDSAFFCKHFKRHTGMRPSEYRKNTRSK